MRARRPGHLGAAILALVVLGAGAAASRAAAPAAPAAARPAPVPVRFLTADSVSLAGEWYAGPARAPRLVLAPRRRGADPELRQLAKEFQARGFGVLAFALRDSQPANRDLDTLRTLVLASRWVDDMVAALREADRLGDATRPLYAWGQGLGAALAVAAAARGRGVCDAVAVEDLTPSIDIALRLRGLSVIPSAVDLQYRMIRMLDDPLSAASRLRIPVLAILLGHDAGTPQDLAWQTLQRSRGRTDRWLRPGIQPPAPTPAAAQVDTLAEWFQRWSEFPRSTGR